MEVWKMVEQVGAVSQGWFRRKVQGCLRAVAAEQVTPVLAAAGDEREWARRLADLHAECDALRGRMGRGRYSA